MNKCYNEEKEIIMNKFYTYIYYDPSRNNEPIYVGKGTGNRAYVHWSKNGKWKKIKSPFIQRLQHMYNNGIDPTIKFLCKNVDEEYALFMEIEAIALYGRKDLGKGSLLNLTDGGENPPNHKGKKWTESRRNNHMSKSGDIQVRTKISDSLKGHNVSDETKEKMRNAKLGKTGIGMAGKKHSDETKAKISKTKRQNKELT